MNALGFYKNLAFFIILLLNLSAHAQSSLVILSEETNQPLPYASIVNHTKQQLFFSNEKGILEHRFEKGDSISITYVGYQKLDFRYYGIENLSVKLALLPSLLNSLTVSACKKWKKNLYSNLKGDSSGRSFGGLQWDDQSLNAKVAILLEPESVNTYLHDFSIWLERFFMAPKESFKAPVKFSFYEKNDSTGLPGNLISNKEIIYQPKKTGRQLITADSLHIFIPPGGLYLCIEYPLLPEFSYPVKFTNKETGTDSIHIMYGARFDGIYAKTNIMVFYNFFLSNWHFARNRTKDDMYKTHGTIKFAYTVKSCAD